MRSAAHWSAPRWMGMAAAWAMVSPRTLKSAAEASRPSLTMGEAALLSSVSSISSAMASSRLRSTSRRTGSMDVRGAHSALRMRRFPRRGFVLMSSGPATGGSPRQGCWRAALPAPPGPHRDGRSARLGKQSAVLVREPARDTLHDAVHEVHDPVVGDPGARVAPGLQPAVQVEAGVGDFHHQGGCRRVPGRGVARRAPHHRHVGFGQRRGAERQRELHANPPAESERNTERLGSELDGPGVRIVLGLRHERRPSTSSIGSSSPSRPISINRSYSCRVQRRVLIPVALTTILRSHRSGRVIARQ